MILPASAGQLFSLTHPASGQIHIASPPALRVIRPAYPKNDPPLMRSFGIEAVARTLLQIDRDS